MAYFSSDDSYYSTPFTPEESDSYPFLQPQAFTSTGEVYDQETSTLADGWTAADQSGSMAGPSTIPPATTNYDENFATCFADPCLPREPLGFAPSVVGSYPAPSHGPYWPMISQPALPHHPGAFIRDGFYPSEQGWITWMPGPPIDSVPTDSWWSQQHGVPTDMPYMDNILNHQQPQFGATRTRMVDSWRFAPYGTYDTRPGMYGTTEAEPSTQIPLSTPHYAPLITQPIGGLSETTADAEQTQQATEEQESPAPQTHRVRGKRLQRPYRERSRKGIRELREWAKAHGGLRRLPSHKDAITSAAEVLSAVQDKVYDEHRLVKGRSRRTKTGSRDADDEYERRNETREAYRKLSRYYRLEEGRLAWSAPRLLSKVLEDLEILEDLLERVVVPTSTVAG